MQECNLNPRQGLVTLTEIKNFPLELMMGYQPGWCLYFLRIYSGRFAQLCVSKGDAEEVAVVVLSLSDLGNRRIKASSKELSSKILSLQEADLWQRKRMVGQLVMEGEVGVENICVRNILVKYFRNVFL